MKEIRKASLIGAVLAAGVLTLFPLRELGAGAANGGHSAHRFVLFLYEGRQFDRSGSHVAEYTAWAKDVRRSGTAVSGDELAGGPKAVLESNSVQMTTEGDRGAEKLTGFFIVEAPDLDRAVRIAKGCPHLKHQGRVVVRPIAD